MILTRANRLVAGLNTTVYALDVYNVQYGYATNGLSEARYRGWCTAHVVGVVLSSLTTLNLILYRCTACERLRRAGLERASA